MRLCDINVGFGYDARNELRIEREEFIKFISEDVFERVAVHPIYLTNIFDANSRIAGLMRHSNKVVGIALINPLREDMAVSELDRITTFMRMSGAMLRPYIHGYSFALQIVSDIIEAIYKFDLPIIVYCEHSFPPTMVKVQALQYSMVDFIVINGVQKYGYGEVSSLMRGCDNVFISTSLLPNHRDLRKIIEEFGPERVLFGSNYPYYDFNYELSKAKSAVKEDYEEELIFRKNFIDLILE